MTQNKPARVDIWHNILWSKYKGEVFSSLHKLNDPQELDIRFFQVAETEGNRVSLGGVDLAHHRYPFDLVFKGSYGKTPLAKRVMALALRTAKSDADLFILTGYETLECWAQLLIIKLKRKKAAVFCDATIHDNKQTFLKGIFKRLFFHVVDGIFGYGPRSKDYVVHYGADPQKFNYRCQAAALPLDYSADLALADRLALAAKPEAPRYLYIGRLSSEKGLDTLLYAFAKVRAQKPKASLILVGGGGERENLEALAQELGLGEAVSFTGGKSGAELFAEYSRATCFVLPSRSEPWGLVVNEALSYGCPVIVSEYCGCVPELVIEGKTGFVHKVNDVDDLAAKMLAAPKVFSDSQKTAEACLEHIINYTPDKAAGQILEGMRAILSAPERST